MVGRLLQAAWHSPQKVKNYGIEEITKLVPVIRTRLLEIVKQTQGSIPEIAVDFMIMFLSDFSLRSAFLKQEVIACFKRLQQGVVGTDQLYMMVALLWPLQKILPEQEITEMVQAIMDTAKQAQFAFKDESAIFILLNALEKTNKAIIKSITRHLGKLQAENNEAFKKVIPKQVGYRNPLKRRRKKREDR